MVTDMATDNSQNDEELEVEESGEVDTTNEANLPGIHTLLVNIQRTTENILKENSKLSNEVGELKSSLRRLESG